MAATIDTLIARLREKDADLADRLTTEIEAGKRKFGLVFEQHEPERIKLYGRTARRGDLVCLDDDDSVIFTVAKPSKPLAIVEHPTEKDAEGYPARTELPLHRLTVVQDFRRPIYPGLVPTGAVRQGDTNSPAHVVINADNFHALKALGFTHTGKVDTIYIDPPYNTGNKDWKYNDRFVDSNDGFRHSKWLSFMERRLKLAKDLLKPTGVIIVAIGDDEHHRLRMLMDQVFGEENFISNVVWQGGVKNNAQFTGGGVDYMVIYASNLERLRGGAPWRIAKEGAVEVVDSAQRALAAAGGDTIRATIIHRQWIKQHKGELPGVVGLYATVDANGRAVRVNGNLSAPGGNGARYTVVNPRTGNPCKVPGGGWRWTEDRMAQAIRDGRIFFPESDDTSPQGNDYLDEVMERVAVPSFVKERFDATRGLETLFGDKRFPNPKDHEVLQQWIGMVTPKDGLVLDFFAGSGSTAEAVIRLNEQDGGTRQCILVTNNEVSAAEAAKLKKEGWKPGQPEWEKWGVCEYVTKPRVKAVLTGIRPDGQPVKGDPGPIAQSVEFFTLDYLDPDRVALGRAFEAVDPLLWLMAGGTGSRVEKLGPEGWALTETYGVLAEMDAAGEFLEALAGRPGVRMAFIVTDSEAQYQQVAARLPEHVEPRRLYESYLHNFEVRLVEA